MNKKYNSDNLYVHPNKFKFKEMNKLKNIPKKIYLQIGDDGDLTSIDFREIFNEIDDITWSEHPIGDNDLEYISMSEYKKQQQTIDKQKKVIDKIKDKLIGKTNHANNMEKIADLISNQKDNLEQKLSTIEKGIEEILEYFDKSPELPNRFVFEKVSDLLKSIRGVNEKRPC